MEALDQAWEIFLISLAWAVAEDKGVGVPNKRKLNQQLSKLKFY
jgi:hypothetical protein